MCANPGARMLLPQASGKHAVHKLSMNVCLWSCMKLMLAWASNSRNTAQTAVLWHCWRGHISSSASDCLIPLSHWAAAAPQPLSTQAFKHAQVWIDRPLCLPANLNEGPCACTAPVPFYRAFSSRAVQHQTRHHFVSLLLHR